MEGYPINTSGLSSGQHPTPFHFPATLSNHHSQIKEEDDDDLSASSDGEGSYSHSTNNNFSELAPRKRISRACDPCRRKRAKCSGDVPCVLCTAKPHLCVYAPVPVKAKTASQPKKEHLKRKEPRQQLPPAPVSLAHPTIYNPQSNSIEARISAVEDILTKMVPNCLVDESVRNTIRPLVFAPKPDLGLVTPQQTVSSGLQPRLLDPPASEGKNGVFHSPLSVGSGTPAPMLVQQPSYSNPLHQQQIQPRSDYKTGGFLLCSDNYALTFWGSTSALGGTANKAHIYKSIPRFVHGVLQALPHASAADVKSPTVASSSLHSQSATPQAIVEPPLVTATSEVPPPTEEEQQKLQQLLDYDDEDYDEVKTLEQLIPLPNDLVDQILKNFWDQFHPQFPLLEKTWFMNQLAHVRTLQSISIKAHWRFILVLLSVVALMINFTPSLSRTDSDASPAATRTSPSSTASSAFKDHDVVLKHLAKTYRRILFRRFESPDIYAVQSLLMMVLTGGCQRGCMYIGVWGYMGIAIRMAQELGLHRSLSELGVQHQRFDQETSALRNRTWHCVMIMETYTCIWTGRPLATYDNDWDAEYPEPTSPELATLKHHIDLAQIIASILRFANRARQVNVQEVIESITSRLKAWLESLDHDWRNLQFPQTERWNSKTSMSLMYNGAVILFHRMAYNRLDAPACLEAAEAITNLVSRFENPLSENECVALFPTFTYCAMLSCTVHISQMLSPSQTTSSTNSRLVHAVSNLEKCMRVFDCLRGIFVDAERCWKTVLDFLTVKGVRMEDLVEAGKNGSAIAAAIAAMNELVTSTSSSSSVNDTRLAVDESGGSGGVGVGPSTGSAAGVQNGFGSDLGSWPPSGFFNEAVARTTNEKRNQGAKPTGQTQQQQLQKPPTSAPQSLLQPSGVSKGSVRKGPVNGVKAIQTMGSNFSGCGSSSISGTAIMGGMGSADLGFVWDGLSLFDLAGLGGIANMQPGNGTDFSMLGGSPSQQLSQQHQNSMYQQQLNQQQSIQPRLATRQFSLPQLTQQQSSQYLNQTGSSSLQANGFQFTNGQPSLQQFQQQQLQQQPQQQHILLQNNNAGFGMQQPQQSNFSMNYSIVPPSKQPSASSSNGNIFG
ncbi:UNVERIFIED_CONTAM: hypothetical protein HDU68_009509 [Siphonaria sp. JEL0065]|nr:hypothetical protein HDU68_009509 [Siphonaria sp. JEL0065]